MFVSVALRFVSAIKLGLQKLFSISRPKLDSRSFVLLKIALAAFCILCISFGYTALGMFGLMYLIGYQFIPFVPVATKIGIYILAGYGAYVLVV